MRNAPASRGVVLNAMRALAVDGVTAEVAAAFDAAEVPFILLKGPVIAQWLYRDGTRSYVDSDLLVSELDETRAEGVLSALGFRAVAGTGWVDPGVARNHTWIREGSYVELHVTLTGLGVEPRQVWAILSEGTEDISLRGRRVRALGLPARLVHVALHAAQHGPVFSQAMRDLELACASHGIADWRAAAALAKRLDAQEAMSAGLALMPEGSEIKRQLGLPEPADPLVLLRARSASPVAMGLARFAGASPRDRGSHILRVLLPTPAFLRWWTPIASRGRRGLLLAYAWRYLYLATSLPAAVRTVARVRRMRAGDA